MKTPEDRSMGIGSMLCILQGVYFLATGIWPVVSIGTFQLVTGPKVDLWLVKTFGVLIGAVGVSLIVAGWGGCASTEVAVLGVGTATGLAAAEINYVLRGRISAIYLADTLVEAGFLVAWGWVFLQQP
jgi:energy-converting hydrogenase Eha subunit E